MEDIYIYILTGEDCSQMSSGYLTGRVFNSIRGRRVDREIAFENKRIYRSPSGAI